MGNWFELYIACPVCYSGGNCSRNERTYWRHTNCSGWLQISDELDLRCDKCLNPSFIMNWEFFCAKHGKYSSLSKLELYRCLNIICDNPKIPSEIVPKMINKINNYN
jgi:hypothetical protein